MNINEAYSFLGLQSTCSDEDINKAYKSAAKKYHPDMPGGNAAKFRKATEAKDFLLKNRKYYRTGANSEDAINELFNNLFNSNRQRQSQQYQRTAQSQKTYSADDLFREYIRQQKIKQDAEQKKKESEANKKEKLIYNRTFEFRALIITLWSVKVIIFTLANINEPLTSTVLLVIFGVTFYLARKIVRVYTSLKELFS